MMVLVLIPFLPLVLALALLWPPLQGSARRLIPAAPLPALFLTLWGDSSVVADIDGVLLGLVLGVDDVRRPFLLLTACLWIAAAVYRLGYLRAEKGREGRLLAFDLFFLAAMAGNLGLIVAFDVSGFYFFFALMTLSSFVLVIHDGDARASRAGRVYIILSILGETMVLLGLFRGADAAESLVIADVASAIADDPLTIVLLFTGFAVKAGQVPLHVWLPLAHSAAPTPASAVLSGAMIKAGILGMVLFLPFGQDPAPDLAGPIVSIGLFTALYGALTGLFQDHPKTVLAYSSLSQMGLMVAALGMAFAMPDHAPVLIGAATVYAVHHGFAKAALFFSVGVVERTPVGGRLIALAAAALCGLSIAGAFPFGGGVTKAVLKDSLGTDLPLSAAFVGLLPLSALATSLLMIRFIILLRKKPGADGAGGVLWAPYLAMVACAQFLPWFLTVPALNGGQGDLAVKAAVSGTGPVLFAVGLAGVAMVVGRRAGLGLPRLPAGDILVPVAGLLTIIRKGFARVVEAASHVRVPMGPDADDTLRDGWGSGLVAGAQRIESTIRTGPGVAVMLLVAILVLALALS